MVILATFQMLVSLEDCAVSIMHSQKTVGGSAERINSKLS
jgi:hypothetical protein